MKKAIKKPTGGNVLNALTFGGNDLFHRVLQPEHPNSVQQWKDLYETMFYILAAKGLVTAAKKPGKGASKAAKSGKWVKSIKGTQEIMKGTNIPKSFVVVGKKVNGKEIWVHANATKHMSEYVNAAKGSVLVENELMTSFIGAVNKVAKKKLKPGKNFFQNIDGWEIGINGETGVIYHALFR